MIQVSFRRRYVAASLAAALFPLLLLAPACAQEPAPASPAASDPAEALYQRYAAAVNKERAWADLEAQVAIGARHPGSPGAEQWRAWAREQLAPLPLDVWEQPFEADCSLTKQRLPGANLIAVYRPQAERFIQFSAHWDSRRFADQDPDESKRTLPCPAANDGASGVAVLMEMARVLSAEGLPEGAPFGVALVFYDFEDQGGPKNAEEFALGSKFFAENRPTTMTLQAAINLDMVADRDQQFEIERFSYTRFPDLVDAYWSHGTARFPDRFSRRRMGFVHDDHIHLLRKGIPSIDLIDFTYAPWHTTGDTADACSPESLRVVALVSLSFLAHQGRGLSP